MITTPLNEGQATTLRRNQEFTSSDMDEIRETLLRYVASRVQDSNSAEDIVHEAILSAIEKKEQFEGKSCFTGWVFGILKRKLSDHFRSRKRDSFVNLSLDRCQDQQSQCSSVAPYTAIEQDEIDELLNQAISEIPSLYRNVFRMRLDGCSTDEICRRLSISPQNAWIRTHRAKRFLRTQIRTPKYLVLCGSIGQ